MTEINVVPRSSVDSFKELLPDAPAISRKRDEARRFVQPLFELDRRHYVFDPDGSARSKNANGEPYGEPIWPDKDGLLIFQ